MAIEGIKDVLGHLAWTLKAYESPAEEILGERLRQAIAPDAKFEPQVTVNTSIGPFRLDQLLTDSAGRKIAIEIDGREFHDAGRDFWRTVFVVGEGYVDVVYRVPATFLKTRLIGVLAALAIVEPGLFNEAVTARWLDATKTNDDVVSDELDENIDDEDEDEDGREATASRGYSALALANRFRSDARDCDHFNIRLFYNFAKGTGSTDLDAIQAEWDRQNPPKPSPSIFDTFDWSSLFKD
jgi:very-short-patch-repair endonuclease